MSDAERARPPEPATPGLPGGRTTASRLEVARRAEQLAQLLQRITALANESMDSDRTLQRAVEEVCATMAWLVGRALRVDPDGRLVPTGPVLVADAGREAVEELRASLEAAPGREAQRVVEERRPRWTPASPPDGNGRSRSVGARPAGARGWLGFPVTAEGSVVAVLEFMSLHEAEPGDDVLAIMAGVGRQLGLLIERNRDRERLEAVNAELARSNRELEQFAYVASHDLQEPLRKIVGFAQLLDRRYGDQLSGEAREFLDIVVDGARRMRRLIDDLLAYSRAGRRRPELETVELGAVVGGALDDLAVAVAESGAAVTVLEPLATVHGNPGELRELVVNLVGNALKYRDEEPPEITVGTTRLSPGWWRLTVADNGIGIAPEHHDRIFEVFQRLHGRGAYAGTGIGLAICGQIAHHHGGRIWVDSTPGEGSAFHVTLPATGSQRPDA